MDRWRVVLVLIAACVGTAAAQDVGVTGLASNTEFQARAGLLGDEGGEVGLWGAWLEEIDDEESRWGGGVYATYDIAQDAAFPIGNLFPFGLAEGVLPPTIPCDIYLGGLAGVLEGSEPDAIAGLFSGLRFDFLALEGHWRPDADVWNELPAELDEWTLMVAARWQF